MEFVRLKRTVSGIDMAPLVDVVFQLLIFFMLSSSFLAPAMKLNLPGATTEDRREMERTSVSIDAEGNIFVNGTNVARGDVRAAISGSVSFSDRKTVDIRCDENVPYRYFVSIMDEARQAGAVQINIVHQGGREK